MQYQSKSNSKWPLTCTPASMQALYVHGECHLYSVLLIKNKTHSRTPSLSLAAGFQMTRNVRTKLPSSFKHLGQTPQTQPSPAQSPSSCLRGHGESANYWSKSHGQIWEGPLKGHPQLHKMTRSYVLWHRHAHTQSFKSITVLESKSNRFNTMKGRLVRYTAHTCTLETHSLMLSDRQTELQLL